MKFALVINLQKDIEKTNEVYQNFQDVAFKNQIELSVEVVGLDNVNTKIKDEDLEEIDNIIIVSEQKYSDKRFKNKNVIYISYNQAIEKYEKLIVGLINVNKMDSIKNSSKIIKVNKINVNNLLKSFDHTEISSKININRKNNFSFNIHAKKPILEGLEAIIPYVLIGGIFALFVFLLNLFGINSGFVYNNISLISTTILSLIIPILSGNISKSIHNSNGFIPGFVGGAIIYISGGGYISACIIGVISGYLVIFLQNKISMYSKINDLYKNILIKFISIIIICIPLAFIVNPFYTYLSSNLTIWVFQLGIINPALSSAMTGILLCVDFGSSFMIKSLTSSAILLSSNGMYFLNTAIISSILIVPIGLGLSTIFAKVKYNSNELMVGKFSFVFGVFGFMPIAMVYALSDPFKVILSSMTGCAITGLMMSILNCSVLSFDRGIFEVFYCHDIIASIEFVLLILVGSVITSYLYSYLRDYK